METPAHSAITAPGERSGAALEGALARLETRWGSAAIRLGNGLRAAPPVPAPASAASPAAVRGALALASRVEPLGLPQAPRGAAPSPGQPLPGTGSLPGEVVSTGFPALDAILGPGGLPRQATVALHGGASSGKTTLALRALAEAQAQGAIAAWLDLAGAFDPLEAAARGVDLRWLVVLRPADPDEGFRLAGTLLAGRAVDLLVVDLPPRLGTGHEPSLRRLVAHARRLGARLVLLEPARLGHALQGALAELTGLRLELERRGWICLGHDVVGQRTAVTVAKNRFGPPGRQVELAIHYLAEGERTADLVRLLDHGPPAPSPALLLTPPPGRSRTTDHAPPPPRLAPPAPPPRGHPAPLAARSARAGRAALGGGHRARREPGRGPAWRTARPAPGERP